MALLDTIQEIENRREAVLNRRERRMVEGEPTGQMPISRERLRMAMAQMDQIYKQNRAKTLQQREQQNRVAEAVARMQQEEAAAQQQPQQQQPQMQQGQSPLMGQVGQMMGAGAMGGMGQAQPQPQAPQSAPQNVSQGLLGMPR